MPKVYIFLNFRHKIKRKISEKNLYAVKKGFLFDNRNFRYSDDV